MSRRGLFHKHGKAAQLSANRFTRAGYTFAGWAKTAQGARAYTDRQSVKNLVKDGSTVKLYALWQAVEAAPRGMARGRVVAKAGGSEVAITAESGEENETRVVATTSDGADGNAVADGDETTAWEPDTTNGAWVVLSFAEVRDVAEVVVVGEGLPEGMRVLLSEDAEAWSEGAGGEARYVWVAFPAGSGRVVVREIVVNGEE